VSRHAKAQPAAVDPTDRQSVRQESIDGSVGVGRTRGKGGEEIKSEEKVMYEFVLWMCLQEQPECPVYMSEPNRLVEVFKAESRQACEALWADSLKLPDPKGLKSRHVCQPIAEPL
jgi:hypothetical protein